MASLLIKGGHPEMGRLPSSGPQASARLCDRNQAEGGIYSWLTQFTSHRLHFHFQTVNTPSLLHQKLRVPFLSLRSRGNFPVVVLLLLFFFNVQPFIECSLWDNCDQLKVNNDDEDAIFISSQMVKVKAALLVYHERQLFLSLLLYKNTTGCLLFWPRRPSSVCLWLRSVRNVPAWCMAY